MALVAVLWVLAALASVALILAQQLQLETQRRQSQADGVRAQAQAQAALVHLMASGVLDAAWPEPPVRIWRLVWPDARVIVRMHSAADAIDLNHAPRDLIAAAFRYAGGLDELQARRWADAIVDERERRRAASGNSQEGLSPYQSVSDLLAYPGLPFDLWLRVESTLTVDSNQPTVDPWAARPAVLWVLAGGDAARAESWLAARAQVGQPDWSVIPAAWRGLPGTDRVILEAEVSHASGPVLRLRWLLARAFGGSDRLSWKILRQTVRNVASPG
ncbi:hypothetical protein Talka_01086 [Tepidimonas alkaliphilus]|uniref:Type II secretion system (T2SS), protein K n=1 Tax=Tepidimonas alkaliphilus TaxID=2588942 RepID=A0A554W9E2_9BURK|nr:hypothetical protein [Tepidimonas alkaliphilus]TSE20191.1 hypothetical protein Talka_01086 [Tepidimonas alkaliphilus]